MRKKVIILILILIIIFCSLFFLNNIIEKTSFMVTPSLFKIVLNEGETISTTLNVKNLGEKQNFSFEIVGLENIVLLEKNNLNIKKGESAPVQIDLSGLDNPPCASVGHIFVSNSIEEKKIPFIASIHTSNQLFAINLNVAPGNKQLTKKEDLITDIRFFNLYDTYPHTVDVNYKILDLYGGEIFSESEEITLGSKSSFTKKFPLPEGIVFGDYVFVVSLDYFGTITTSSYLFSVVSNKFDSSILNINPLAIMVLIFIIFTFFLVLYTLHERSKLISQLKKQHKLQIKHSLRGILHEQKKSIAKVKDKKKREKVIKEFSDAKKKVLGELRKQQKKQIKEATSLKEKKVKNKEKKLMQWGKESYSKALENAQISHNLKNKLAVLKNAYDEGFIKKKSYDEGRSNLKSANRKLKRNIYK